MGFDLYGNSKNKKGEYFRNNVWWWRPLWAFCYENYEIARKVENGHSNDGDGLALDQAQVAIFVVKNFHSYLRIGFGENALRQAEGER